MKELTPVRLIKNKFYKEIEAAEERGASLEEIKEILGRARAKKGMFEGDLDEGELEIGQVSANINEVKPAGEIVREIWNDFIKTQQQIAAINAD
jgi:enoyl-[acyl-carrier protein] reductase II